MTSKIKPPIYSYKSTKKPLNYPIPLDIYPSNYCLQVSVIVFYLEVTNYGELGVIIFYETHDHTTKTPNRHNDNTIKPTRIPNYPKPSPYNTSMII